MNIYKCEHCGTILEEITSSSVCCGQTMKLLVPGTSDGAAEKHVPVYETKDGKVFVKVGSAEHPMTEAHYIEWIAIETNQGVQRKNLTPSSKPQAEFALVSGETVKDVYAYCNLHGLWKA